MVKRTKSTSTNKTKNATIVEKEVEIVEEVVEEVKVEEEDVDMGGLFDF